MRTSEHTGVIMAAMFAASGQIPAIRKTMTNPDTNSKYIPLDSIISVVKPILAAEGVYFMQSASAANGMMTVVTRFIHGKSAEWIETDSCVPIIGRYQKGGGRHDADAQAAGSSISYARRYGLAAALGIVSDTDDDGRAARAPEPQARPAARPGKPDKPVERVAKYVSGIMPAGAYVGQPFEQVPTDELTRFATWLVGRKQPTVLKDVNDLLNRRAIGQKQEPAAPMTTALREEMAKMDEDASEAGYR